MCDSLLACFLTSLFWSALPTLPAVIDRSELLFFWGGKAIHHICGTLYILHQGFPVQLSVDVRELAVQCVFFSCGIS